MTYLINYIPKSHDQCSDPKCERRGHYVQTQPATQFFEDEKHLYFQNTLNFKGTPLHSYLSKPYQGVSGQQAVFSEDIVAEVRRVHNAVLRALSAQKKQEIDPTQVTIVLTDRTIVRLNGQEIDGASLQLVQGDMEGTGTVHEAMSYLRGCVVMPFHKSAQTVTPQPLSQGAQAATSPIPVAPTPSTPVSPTPTPAPPPALIPSGSAPAPSVNPPSPRASTPVQSDTSSDRISITTNSDVQTVRSQSGSEESSDHDAISNSDAERVGSEPDSDDTASLSGSGSQLSSPRNESRRNSSAALPPGVPLVVDPEDDVDSNGNPPLTPRSSPPVSQQGGFPRSASENDEDDAPSQPASSRSRSSSISSAPSSLQVEIFVDIDEAFNTALQETIERQKAKGKYPASFPLNLATVEEFKTTEATVDAFRKLLQTSEEKENGQRPAHWNDLDAQTVFAWLQKWSEISKRHAEDDVAAAWNILRERFPLEEDDRLEDADTYLCQELLIEKSSCTIS